MTMPESRLVNGRGVARRVILMRARRRRLAADQFLSRHAGGHLLTHRRLGAEALGQERAQDSQPVAERVQVTHPVNARMLEARHLGDGDPRLGRANMYQRLDLKPVTPQPASAGRRW
jgi:hypothetical protein